MIRKREFGVGRRIAGKGAIALSRELPTLFFRIAPHPFLPHYYWLCLFLRLYHISVKTRILGLPHGQKSQIIYAFFTRFFLTTDLHFDDLQPLLLARIRKRVHILPQIDKRTNARLGQNALVYFLTCVLLHLFLTLQSFLLFRAASMALQPLHYDSRRLVSLALQFSPA